MRRVELFELIRHDHLVLKLSQREINRKRGTHRRIIAQAVASAVPPERKKPERTSSKLTPEVKAFIDDILVKDKQAPRKQRHTARRIWQRLTEEKHLDVAESTIRRYVGNRKRELGLGIQAFVPQHHPVGKQGEVDFYEMYVDFPWGRHKAKVVETRSEFSAASLHVAYPSQTQAALLEGIELGLEFFGGVFEVMRFDNLTQAVARVIRGERRVEQDRFIAFRSHHLFESSFTTPGIEGAHEKGGIENEAGRFRRRWLTPVPKVDSWEHLNEYLKECCIKDLDRRVEGQSMTVGEMAAIERDFLKPLATERFELAELAEPRVDQKARIRVRSCNYSVPARLVGRKVSVRLTPTRVEVSHDGSMVAIHERLHMRGAESLDLDHYLELLHNKPGAFPGSLPLHQARTSGDFPQSYESLWTKLKERLGPKDGTRKMIEVVLLHRSHPIQVVREAVEQALASGTIDPAMIKMLARHIKDGICPPSEKLEVGDLDRYDRPLPDTQLYDSLLTEAVMA